MKHGRRYLPTVLALLSLAACTGGARPTITSPTPSTAAPSPSVSGPSVSSPSASRPSASRLAGEHTKATPSTPAPVLTSPGLTAEVDGTCPYISAADFSSYEGDHVGRVTLIQTKPVGCRFYFYYQPMTDIVGEVLVQVFSGATPAQADINANNAMVIAAKGHPELQSETTIGDGAIAFKTVLQGVDTWQCLVTLGNRVYTVRTRQSRPSLASYAFNLATALVAAVK